MRLFTSFAALTLAAAPALADGDAAVGEKEFGKCKSCHMIASADEVFQKGGKTGPNLYGVVGRAAGAAEDFKYSTLMMAAAETGLVWDTENLVSFLEDPSAYLQEVSGEKGRSKMSLKLRKKGEDVAAYLATFSPEAGETEAEADESGS